MAIESRDILKTFFQTGDIPTQAQFGDVIDSYIHREDDNVTIYLEPGTTDKRFGIGITTPEAPLGVMATGDDELLVSFNKAGDELATWFFNIDNSGTSGFNITEKQDTGLVSHLFIQETDGHVGLGTTTPSDKLHVQESTIGGATTIRIENTATAANNSFGLGHEEESDEGLNGSFSIYENEFSQANKRLVIRAGGKVGVNEILPDTYLHVSADLALPETDIDLIAGTGIVTVGPITSNIVADYRGLQARTGEYEGTEIILSASELNLQRMGGSILFHGDDLLDASVKGIITEDGFLGLGVLEPVERIEIDGALKLGTSLNDDNGTIRYTGEDFEGRKAGEWVSLTGSIPPPVPQVWTESSVSSIYYYPDSNTRVGIGTDTHTATLDVSDEEFVAGGNKAVHVHNFSQSSSLLPTDHRVGLEIRNTGEWNPNAKNIGLYISEVSGMYTEQSNIAAVMNGNVLIGDIMEAPSLGAEASHVLAFQTGTAPTYIPGTNSVQVYSENYGTDPIPTLHVMRADGDVVKLYREEALSLTDSSALPDTYDPTVVNVINRLRLRVEELETRLVAIGLLHEPVIP